MGIYNDPNATHYNLVKLFLEKTIMSFAKTIEFNIKNH